VFIVLGLAFCFFVVFNFGLLGFRVLVFSFWCFRFGVFVLLFCVLGCAGG
jgi:hypothetical protein